jgi:hypothetical protein
MEEMPKLIDKKKLEPTQNNGHIKHAICGLFCELICVNAGNAKWAHKFPSIRHLEETID